MTETEQASQAFMHAANRATTLYALSDEYTRLVDLLEDPEADPALVEQELDRISGAIAQKAEAIAGLIKWYEGLANMREAEAKRMAAPSNGRLSDCARTCSSTCGRPALSASIRRASRSACARTQHGSRSSKR